MIAFLSRSHTSILQYTLVSYFCFSFQYAFSLEAGIRQTMIDDADMICIGAFSSEGLMPASVQRHYRVELAVDKVLKGDKQPRLSILIPTSFGTDSGIVSLPARDKLLLLLKKTEIADTFTLVDQYASWLLASEAKHVDAKAPVKEVILAMAESQLQSGAAKPGSIDLLMSKRTDNKGQQQDFKISAVNSALLFRQAIATVGHLGEGHAVLSFVEKIASNESGDYRFAALAALANLDFNKAVEMLLSLNAGNALTIRERLNLSADLVYVIRRGNIKGSDSTTTELIGKLLASSGPEARRSVAYALRKSENPTFRVALMQQIGTSDLDLQYEVLSAMHSEFLHSSSNFSRPAKAIFLNSPDKYMAPYRDWWVKNKERVLHSIKDQ
jgi:hypothetical protein